MMQFRLIDSGVDDGRRQIALDAALTELHASGRSPDTIRFLRFPPTVLIGRHQVMAREVQLARCREDGVALVRRVSGGGAIYLDQGQVGWELVFARRHLPGLALDGVARVICEAVAGGLSAAFGIEARFRPRNDIEVDGRKLCGTGGFFVGDTLVYQGTVLLDMDPSRVRALLNVPEAKLARHSAADAGARLVTLKALLGAAPSVENVHSAILQGLAAGLGIEVTQGSLTEDERALAGRFHAEEIGTDAFVMGIDEPGGEGVLDAEAILPGGTVRAHLRLEGRGPARRIREALVTGDFFVAPPRAILDLEARLRGVTVAEVAATVDAFLAEARPAALSLPPEAFRDVILAALATDAAV